MLEKLELHGHFDFVCVDKDGNVKWTDAIENTVVTVGKDLLLDTFLSGSAYTTTGPFLGLISSVSFSAISAADSMASHGGWLEAGGANAPQYTSPRPTMSFASASGGSKSLATAASFAITSSGTVKGGFVTLGSGAVGTIDNAGGVLFSAGLFTGGDQVVASSDTMNVTYSLSV